MAPKAGWVEISHPKLREEHLKAQEGSEGEKTERPNRVVTKASFDEVWSEKGWELVEQPADSEAAAPESLEENPDATATGKPKPKAPAAGSAADKEGGNV